MADMESRSIAGSASPPAPGVVAPAPARQFLAGWPSRQGCSGSVASACPISSDTGTLGRMPAERSATTPR